ncbi:MAG: glycerol-3-phosphate dehydrogenase [Alphaproteobacteria bacterium]|nr:MAG: glycerol-3-phosphate dehydrogenase [Alphaproteobacteria bacterium]
MREGGLEAPRRHPVAWKEDDFWDEAKLDAELRRVYDICHGCRRCFNLCESFPRLFDLIDATASGEMEDVSSQDFPSIEKACTLCDMCYQATCPYVPPHEFNLDFPHLMLRARAVRRKKEGSPWAEVQLTQTDRNGAMARLAPEIANWLTDTRNQPARVALEKVAQVDRRAALPQYHGKTLVMQARENPPVVNAKAPAYGKRKAVVYATCFSNYNNPAIGMAALAVLAHCGVETEVVYPRCCGMPQLEQGDLGGVNKHAATVAEALSPWIDKGYDVIALVPSCALMLKSEWPLLVPTDAPHRALVQKLATASYDISEYVISLAKREGVPDQLKVLEGGITLHIACHARAQNIGLKAAEMLRLIPGQAVKVIERCSGHGGSWGVLKENFDSALKVGKPVMRQAAQEKSAYLASECPLAGAHIAQGMELMAQQVVVSQSGALCDPAAVTPQSRHPIELMALAYGLENT